MVVVQWRRLLPMSGGRHNTTNQCRRRQCSQSSLSLLAACGVDLPCHWCCGCLGVGPRWSLLAAWCSVLLLRRRASDRRNANPPIHRHRIPVHRSRRIEKRAECPQAGKKTSCALHDIPNINDMHNNDCVGDTSAAWMSAMVRWRIGVSYIENAASRRATDRLTCAWLGWRQHDVRVCRPAPP